MLLVFFQKVGIWFRTTLQELANNSISVLLLVVCYLMLWHFPQTIDLLLILHQSNAILMEVPLYFAVLTVLAFLIWNTPKYLTYQNYKQITFRNVFYFVPKDDYCEIPVGPAKYSFILKTHLRKVIPRILGTILLLLSAIGILNAMEIFQLQNAYTQFLSPGAMMGFCMLFLLLLTEPNFYNFI